jgi:hypothetical protein
MTDENSRFQCLFVNDNDNDSGGSNVQRVGKRNAGVSNSDALAPPQPERGRRASLQPEARSPPPGPPPVVITGEDRGRRKEDPS